jgi:hypothetical protein
MCQWVGRAVLLPAPIMLKRLLTRENLWAAALCLIVIAVVVLTADNSPRWIYQGF